MPYEERFDLLIRSGQASARSVAAAQSALRMAQDRLRIPLGEEIGAALATHLAITLKRVLSGEELSRAPDVVWQELQDHPDEVQAANAIVEMLTHLLDVPIARDEAAFIAVHLCRIAMEGAADAAGGSATEAREPQAGTIQGEPS